MQAGQTTGTAICHQGAGQARRGTPSRVACLVCARCSRFVTDSVWMTSINCTMLGCCNCFRMLISRTAVDGVPSSSLSRLASAQPQQQQQQQQRRTNASAQNRGHSNKTRTIVASGGKRDKKGAVCCVCLLHLPARCVPNLLECYELVGDFVARLVHESVGT